MRRATTRRMAIVVLGLLAPGLSGCTSFVNLLAVPYFLFAGEPMEKPRVDLLKGCGKKEKRRLLVLSYAQSGLHWGFDAIDSELTGLIVGEVKQREPRFDVVSEREVRNWRDKTPNWADFSLQKIAEAFGVDYVMFLEVRKFSISEAKNQFLLRGNTSVMVKVHDVGQESLVFDDLYARDYPANRSVPINDVPNEDVFRTMFLRTIAKELSWYIVPHRADEVISDLK